MDYEEAQRSIDDFRHEVALQEQAERHDAACAAQQPGQDDAMVAVEAREYLPADVRTSRASVTTGVRASIKKRTTAFPADESTIWKGTDNLERNRLIQEKQTAQCKGRLHLVYSKHIVVGGDTCPFRERRCPAKRGNGRREVPIATFSVLLRTLSTTK